jgi:hypothetical protein
MSKQTQESLSEPRANKSSGVLSDLAYAAGIILAISYPVLAISTGARAIYQLLFKPGVTDYLPSALSAVAAVCYLFAAIGFTYRRQWAWRLSVGLLGFEMLMVLVVGSLSFIYPEMIGRTVWGRFGADYGYFPFFQPLLGLIWLFSLPVLRAYGIMGGKAEEKSATNFTN